MTFHILNTGASALTAAQRAVETAAHNAANSTVPGYTRQRVAQAATVPAQGANGVLGSGHRGTGVQVVSIDRLRDVLADVAVRMEEGAAGSAVARAEVLDRAQGVLGQYGAGLPDALNKLWAAFDQLSLTPAEPAARQIVLDAAAGFANGMNDAAEQLAQIRADALHSAQAVVTEVNDLATEVANLNRHIVAARNGGQAPNDLLDRRDLLLDKLAGLAGATVRQRADGGVDVSVGGAPLVQGPNAFTLVPDTPGGNLSLTLHGRPVTVGGQLGGRVQVLGAAGDLRDIEGMLDGVAQAVGGAVNGVHTAGFDAKGRPGAPFFAGGTPVTALTLTVAIDDPSEVAAASTSGSVLNGENALDLAKLRQHKTGGVTFGERLNEVASALGSRAAAALAESETAQVAVTSLREQRASQNGVSIDEEMVELVKFQHSYDAAARVISIADEMLNTLINRMGAGR